MKAEISFDLIMEEDMPFVEGCYRIEGYNWQVFIFLRPQNISEIKINKDIKWKSGVTGLTVVTPYGTRINKISVFRILSDALGVTEWLEVRGPDSMQLR